MGYHVPEVSAHCEKHSWTFEPGDECPTCEGMRLERERIIQVIRDWYEADADLIDGPGNLIDWIENGDNEVSDDLGLLTPAEATFVEAHDEKVRRAERSRIIALLEANGYDSQHLLALIRDQDE